MDRVFCWQVFSQTWNCLRLKVRPRIFAEAVRPVFKRVPQARCSNPENWMRNFASVIGPLNRKQKSPESSPANSGPGYSGAIFVRKPALGIINTRIRRGNHRRTGPAAQKNGWTCFSRGADFKADSRERHYPEREGKRCIEIFKSREQTPKQLKVFQSTTASYHHADVRPGHAASRPRARVEPTLPVSARNSGLKF